MITRNGGGGGGWEMGEICPKLSHTLLLIKQKLISTPPSHNDNFKANSPLLSLKKVSSY